LPFFDPQKRRPRMPWTSWPRASDAGS
jgi:hypothetical protein